MNFLVSIIAAGIAVAALMAAGLGLSILSPWLIAVGVPALAVLVFVGGFIWKVLRWAKSPVPFAIPTTCGQSKSMPWIKDSKLDSPPTKGWVVARMALEIFTFRSLVRNTNMSLKDGPTINYGSTQWLWLFALMFHYAFLTVFIRHFRFFLEPVPLPLKVLENLDGFLQVGLPGIMISGFVLFGAVGYLLLRRLAVPNLRYISLPNDYFPLLLIASIVGTGILMRYVFKTDVVAVKEVMMGLVSFHVAGDAMSNALTAITAGTTHFPLIGDVQTGYLFFIHIFLVSALIAYFPFSKLMHLGGVWMSPTRNLPTNTREVRHVNPWGDELLRLPVHTYDHYEDEFREKMIDAGLPVEKQPEDAPAKEE